MSDLDLPSDEESEPGEEEADNHAYAHEFECIACGSFTFVTSGATSTSEWAARAESHPTNWATYPDRCVVGA